MNKLRSAGFTFILLFIAAFCKSQSQSVQWAEQFGGTGEEYGFGIAVDDSSNSYVTGYVDAANGIRQNGAANCINHDIFLVKYNKQGIPLWMEQIGGSTDDIGWSVALDKNNNVYIAANFQDTLNLSTGVLISNDYKDILVAKYTSSGVLQWAKQAGGSMGNYGYGIATDSQNNVYVTGSFYGTAHFENDSITSHGSSDIFLAKYDSDGNLQWVINEGGSSQDYDEGYAICVDKDDNIYTCGKYGGTAVFSGDTLKAKGSSDCFLAKHTADGTLQWVRSAGGTSVDIAQGVSSDKSGNIFVTGYYSATGFFGADTLTSHGSSDIFIAKYNSSGSMQWAKGAGGSGADEGAGITVDKKGNCYTTGYFNGNAVWSSSTIMSNGGPDIYVTSLDSTGNYNWTAHCGSAGVDAASSIKADTSGNVFFTGTFSSTSSFGPLSMTSAGETDFFIAEITAGGTVGIIEKNNESDLLVYPNPTTSSFTLHINGESSFALMEVNILNSMGQAVLRKQLKNNSNTIDLGPFGKGIYFIDAVIDNKHLYKKIIVN